MTDPNTGIPGNPNPAAPVANPPAGAVQPATPARPATPAPGANIPGVTSPQAPQSGTVPLAALQEERDRRQALAAEVENLKRQISQVQQPYQPVQAPQADPYQQRQAQKEKLWETDPRQAVQAEIVDAFTYYDRINAQAELEAEALRVKYPDFDRYRANSLNYVRTLPYDQRGQRGIVELAYMLVRGQDVDNILKTREQELITKFQSGQLAGQYNLPAGTYVNPQVQGGGVVLSDEQKAVAGAMGLTPEAYASQIKITAPVGR